jgi:subtilisin-like proprotein convertase family protein
MRRVEIEGDSPSSRRRDRGVARPSPAYRPRLRRLALDRLEDRTLMSTLPSAITVGQTIVGLSDSGQGNSSSPSVAVDPLDPNKLIAAWTTFDPGNKLDGTNGQVTTYIQGGYSVDGGKTWAELPNDMAVDVQTDFTVALSTSGPQPNFAQTTDATVGFGRDQMAYLLSSTHSGGGGVLDLQKWDFSNANPTTAPVSQSFTTPAYDTLSGNFFGPPSTVNPIYRWQGGDAALTPTLAVDNNVASFTDGGSTQIDPHAGNVYVAWETNDAAPKGVTVYNPNLIKIMSSADGGQNFTYQAYLNTNHGQGPTYDQPKIAISQGSSTVTGGQVTIVYANAGAIGTVAPFFDEIITQSSKTGGTDLHVNSPRNVPISLGSNAILFPVNVSDPNFSLQNLTVTLSLTYPNLNDTSATLTSPPLPGLPNGRTVTLWNNATDAGGNATNLPGTLSGANIGASALSTGPLPEYIGTTLDSTAFRSLSVDGGAPYTGHFRPFGNLQNAFQGLTAGGVNGTWTLTITQFRPETITPPTPFPTLYGASLDFTSGLSDVTNGPESLVSLSFLNSGTKPFIDGIQGVPVLANPTLASDNTLGSHSPHQGRLYLAFTDDNYSTNAATPGAYTTATFIRLYFSDNGGRNWFPDTTDAITGLRDGIVNDDNGLKDGFSTGGFAQPGSGTGSLFLAFNGEANVRPKMEPQLAVDPQTGTLVVSFLDTRNDASGVRVATYLAVSTDGGASFAPETYANASNPLATLNPITGLGIPTITRDAITGLPVNLGPIPENESGANGNRDTTFGFGQRQGLAVANGEIIPVWSSNQNGTTLFEPTLNYVGAGLFSNAGSNVRREKPILNIESAVVNYAAGPRVLSSTQGPVGEPGDTVNPTRTADGTPIANTIVLTFDRAVDPASFPADGATIGSSPLQVFYNFPSGTPAPVPLRVTKVSADSTDTVYTVTFDPAGHGVGSYTYTLRPLVRGMIPYETALGASSTQQVPFVDTAVNGGQVGFTVSGHPGIQLTTASLSGLVDIYQQGVSTGSPTDLQIFLVAQDGRQYTLFSGTTQGQQANVGFDVSNTITIPAIPAEALDQNYTIKLVDNVPNEKAFLYNDVNPDDFNFQVTLSNQAATTVSGNPLDQNANGVPGEMPGDNYSVPDGRNSLPLIVPGPHVSTTSVNGASGVVSSGPDNLVTNHDPSSINVTFDRAMQTSTFTPSQILSIVGPAGRIDGRQVFPSTGTSKTFAFNGPFLPIPKSGTLTSTIPISGTGLTVSNLSVKVNITDPNDASLQLTLVAPDGTMVSLVAAGAATGANFTNTVFSDAPPANGLSLTVPGAPAGSAAPYSLTYQPASPLAALAGKPIDGTWKLMVTDSTAGGPQGRLNAWSLNITPRIPQGPSTMLDSSLVVSSFPDNSFKIAHLAVQLNISSTKDSDLQVYLVAPDGVTVIPLILNVGGSSGTNTNFTNTTLDDSATIPIASGVAPFNLTYKPAMNLSGLNGLSIEGTWKLRIVNPNADGSVSTLNSWSLIAIPKLTITPVAPLAGAAATYTIAFPTQKLSGTYAVTLSPNILSVAPDPSNPTMGAPLDTNLNAGVDSLRGTTTGVTSTVVYPATSVPVAIPYASKLPIGPTVPGVLKSQINVPDNFAIQGDAGTLAGLTVSFNISYYNDPDLTATLTAPNGKTITLFAKVGKGSSTANFTNTTLSDTITPLAPITAAGAPFFGTFNPQTPLSGFTTDPAGNQAFSQGLWTLTINNAGLDPGPDIDAIHPPTLLSWSLAFQKPQTNTGLGEPVADQKTVTFRLFNIAPSDPLANDTWTAVGPAGTVGAANPLVGNPGGVNLGGPVSVVALDPSDPSGNTAFIGASSGGVWKTSNFLTTAAGGPTYVPLTDFGSNYAINIGSIAVFGRNNDPSQSIVFAGTGDAQASTANSGNSVQGVGILRSTNGGASFTLLDSSVNVDSAGNPLPINSPLRDHIFVGTTTYKIVVDRTPPTGGGVIVYAALGGKNGGLWRSTDGGNTWQNFSAGVIPQVNGQNAAATDIILDPVRTSRSTGNLDILYAAFQGVGVYISTNQGRSLTEVLGNVGATNLIQNSQTVPGSPLRVNDANPNGSFGRIILAKPALTNNAAQNILYQDWLYAAVETTTGEFQGLYVTKDRGENWTLARIANYATPANVNAVTQAQPTNDNTVTLNYDVTDPQGGNGGSGFKLHNGNSAFSMTIDPLDPNIVYLGGTQDYQASGLIRVDLTGIYDAHAFVPFPSDRNDGGALARDATGRANVNLTNFPDPFFEGTNPSNPALQTGEYYTNLRHSPTDPFNVSSTLFVYNSSAFTNDGTGVKWQPIDQVYGDPLGGSTNIHQLLSVVDPLTGLTRLIVSDDQGVFTGVYNADGSLSTAGLGTAATVTGSRNGNLQDEQIYYSAAQPSALAAQAAGALFYGSGIGMTDAQSASNLLSTGNLTWLVQGPAYGDVQNSIMTNDRGGTGIGTDPTGGVSAANPKGSPSLYEFDIPLLGGDTTNFFRVQNNGSTTGLTNQFNLEFPGTNAQYNGVIPLGNFTVNPITGSQLLISSNLGNLYETTNRGVQWLQIGSGSGDFDKTYAPAVAFGAPDPGAPNGVGNLNNFIYAGTVGGHIYVTRTGAGPWTNLSAGLDGSSVLQIFTNPNRGSREAYAVTLNGVYFMADSSAASASWVNITGNLTQLQHNAFNDPTLSQNALLGYSNGQLGGFRSIVADYRYAIPDPVVSTTTFPVLYVAGYGGVFRSLDNGQTWTAFPNVAFDAAPADGGFLPNVEVTGLQLNLGAVNPATGHASQAPGDPVVLLASTLGRGDFAIRLAPDVFPTTVGLDPTLPAPGGSQTGTLNGLPLTNVVRPFIAGSSEISNFGNVVTITLIDEANGLVIGTGTTDTFGHFSVQVGSLANDPSFGLDGVKAVGVQATDLSGAKGNVTLFTYVLKTTLPPPAPTGLTLDPSTNSGLDKSQNITNFTHPLFDVTGVLAGDFLELFRSINISTPIQVGTAAVGATKILDAAGVPADGVYVYTVVQVNSTADVSPSSPGLVVTVNTKLPAVPTEVLFPADDSGALTGHPNVTNVRTPRFFGNGTPGLGITILSVTGGPSTYPQGVPIATALVAADGTYLTQFLAGVPPLADKVYTLVARTINAAGNVSFSAPLTVTIKATPPQIVPTLSIFPADDTGIKGDNVTANRRPRFVGTTDPGVTVSLFSLVNGQLVPTGAFTTSSTVNGSFQIQLPSNLSDGNTQLVAQATDIAGNTGPISPALAIRIITVAGDYINAGAAQFAVFQPTTETYFVLGVGAFTADSTPGRDVPVQYDFNGDGKIDPVAYRYNTAEYFGSLSSGANLDFQFGTGGTSLPVSGNFDSSGLFEYGLYNVNTALWALNLPRPGGEVIHFGVPKVDIPVPAAYDGNGVTEIATFRPSVVNGNDADSFNVVSPNFSNNYQVSFTDPAVPALKGFTSKAGDIPAPADYDGIGRDEFAIYRPTTGQFFILKVPNLFDKSTWTLRTVTLNIPGGPRAGDQPVSEDYEGTGKASPTVFRPSTATFYEIQSTNGIQRNFQFGQGGVSVAAAGPLLYRLSALFGPFASTGGYGISASAITAGSGVHADAIASTATTTTTTTTGGGTSQAQPGPSMIALAMPTTVVTGAPAASIPVPTVSSPAVTTQTTSPAVVPQASLPLVTVGASTPRTAVKAHVASKAVAHPAPVKKASHTSKPAHQAAAPARPLKVETSTHQAPPKSNPHPDQHHAAVAAALVHLGPIRKGRNDD